MSKHCQQESGSACGKAVGWDAAISDAKKRIKELEFSIKVFRERKKAGEIWPQTIEPPNQQEKNT